MPSVTDFIVDKATLRFGDDDDLTEIVYRPSLLTADRSDDFFDRLNENDVLAASYLLTGYDAGDALIVSWNITGPVMGRRAVQDAHGEDVTDERGRPIREQYEAVAAGETVPLDAGVLRFLNVNVLLGLYRKLQEDCATLVTNSPNFTRTKTASLNGSSRRS